MFADDPRWSQSELSALEAELECALAGLGSLQDGERHARDLCVAEHTVLKPLESQEEAVVSAVRAMLVATGSGCSAVVGAADAPETVPETSWVTRSAFQPPSSTSHHLF